MAINKEDIKELSTDELAQRISEEKVRYQKMKFNHTVSPLDNANVLRTLRKDIARLKTELRKQTESKASAENKTRNLRKQRTGVVTSNKMDKSITVMVERRLKHTMYGKYMKKSSRFIAHDEKNECNIGDTVRIMETRPISKQKRWRLVEIIEKAK